MKQLVRPVLLLAAAALMLFGAIGDAFIVMPELHGDLVEIGVRPTVLGGTALHFLFAAFANFAFAFMVCAAAYQAMRGIAPARTPLILIAVTYTAFGIIAFSRSHNPHHLGPLVMGLLVAAALIIPGSERSSQ